MPRQRRNPSNTINNQSKEAALKENTKSPENKIKQMEICNLSERELEIAILKKA